MRSVGLAALALVVTAAGCGGSSHTSTSRSTPARSGPTFRGVVTAELTGAAEPSHGAAGGSGSARITLDARSGKACWTLSVHGIDRPLSAHVHEGKAGVVGPVVIPLGSRFERRGCVLAPRSVVAAVGTHPDGYYVNVHTSHHLNGAVRGPLESG